MKIDSRGAHSVNMTRVVVISVLLFCSLADSARIKRRVASRAYDNRGGEGPGLWSREPNANPTGPNSYDNRGGEGPGLWSRRPNANPTGPNANPTGPNSYDNRGGEGPGLWSREPNANPTGPNSYDNRGGEGPGLWSRRPNANPTGPNANPTGPNANPTGPNSYDNRGGEGQGLWSREPNANPTGPNSYDNRGGEGPGLWSRRPNANPTGPNANPTGPNANPTGPNSYDNRGGEGPGLWSREPNANPTGPNSYDNRGGEGPGLWSREPNANPTRPNSYDNRGGEGPGLWSREPNANPTGPNSYDNRGGEGPGLWSREPNANPTGPNSYDNRGGEGPGLWSREPNANPTGPNSYDNRGGEGPGLWSREPNANPTGPNSYDNRGGEEPGLYSPERYANPSSYSGQTCASMDGSCVATEGECANDVVPGLGCNESPLCCLPAVLPEHIGGLEGLKGPIPGTMIVGGTEAARNRWPWQVSLQTSQGFHFCGGSLLNDQWVLTAAHCLASRSIGRVVLGDHDLTTHQGTEVIRGVSHVVEHPSFQNYGSYPNDIALVKLDTPVSFSAAVQPIYLSNEGDSFNNNECWITGWGETRNTGDPTKLNELVIKVIDQQSCARQWQPTAILNTHICVGDGETGACSGDSGGPLSCMKNGKWTLAGVTSFGVTGCETGGSPDVYTRVSMYRPWIEYVIRRGGRE